MPFSERDHKVRLHVYERLVAEGRPPTHTETASALGITETGAAKAYRRLAEERVLVLAPGSLRIWMASPFSACPTGFWVETPRGGYWGNCIWDGFGVIAMLGGTGTVYTSCPDCGEAMTLRVTEGKLEVTGGVAHFAVPARRWWDNIGYT
jgi:hypothetical protein